MREIIFFCGQIILLAITRDVLRAQKSRGPLKISREVSSKVIFQKQKIPNFQNQRYIGNFMSLCAHNFKSIDDIRLISFSPSSH
jgi:hypothetical protein